MKINGGPEKAFGVYNKRGVKQSRIDRTGETGAVRGRDKIELSTEAKDFQTALKAFSKAPEIREAKVAQLKARIDAGKYSVDAGDVADSIMDGLFFDKRV